MPSASVFFLFAAAPAVFIRPQAGLDTCPVPGSFSQQQRWTGFFGEGASMSGAFRFDNSSTDFVQVINGTSNVLLATLDDLVSFTSLNVNGPDIYYPPAGSFALVDVINGESQDVLVSSLRPVWNCWVPGNDNPTPRELENTTFVEVTDDFFYRSLPDLKYQDVRNGNNFGSRVMPLRGTTYDPPFALGTRVALLIQRPTTFTVNQELISETRIRVDLEPNFDCQEARGAVFSEGWTEEPRLVFSPNSSVISKSFSVTNVSFVVEQPGPGQDVEISYMSGGWTHTVSWVPTPSPSKAPSTLSPSSSPVIRPSFSPSRTPSKSPFSSGTQAPSKSPTRAPTQAPSLSPTRLPSKSPTLPPTKVPSKSPTTPTTQPPTTSPTPRPSSSPTSPGETTAALIAGITLTSVFITAVGLIVLVPYLSPGTLHNIGNYRRFLPRGPVRASL